MSERPTPETDGQASSIGIGCGGTYSMVDAEFARELERERDDYKWQLHIAKGEIAEARKMERTWKKEETHATAQQHAEAFLRAIGKWKEEVK